MMAVEKKSKVETRNLQLNGSNYPVIFDMGSTLNIVSNNFV